MASPLLSSAAGREGEGPGQLKRETALDLLLVSTDLVVRYSDIMMQAERDFNNLTRSSATSSDYDDSTLSVRDARKRFEQMSSASSTAAAPSYKRKEGGTSNEAPPSRPPPPIPLKKRISEPVLRSQSTCSTSSPQQQTQGSNSRVQRSSNQSPSNSAKETDCSTQDVNGSTKPKAKPSLKKASSVAVDPNVLANPSSETSNSTSSSKQSSSPTKQSSSPTKRLFKRMSTDKGKVDSGAAASNGSSKARTSKNGEANQNSPSPTHKKFSSPLALKKKKTTSSSGSSQPSLLGDKPATLRKSFSNNVLASSEERRVQASLKEDNGGKVVGGSRPTAPRVIEDGELKLNLTEGKKDRVSLAAGGPLV